MRKTNSKETNNKERSIAMRNNNATRMILPIAALLISAALISSAAPKEPAPLKLETMLINCENPSLFPLFRRASGRGVGDQILDNVLATKGVNVLSAPIVTARPGTSATVACKAAIQYFERTAEGTFALKHLSDEEAPGTQVTTTMNPTVEGLVNIALDVKITTLGDRKHIPGVSLDVGEPSMQQKTIQTEMTVPFNQWRMLGGGITQDLDTGKMQYLFIFFRVTQDHPDQTPNLSLVQ